VVSCVIQALNRTPNTSKPAPGHKVYRYLLRKQAVTRPNQVWSKDITYILIAAYAFVNGAAVEEVGFLLWEEKRCGGSSCTPSAITPARVFRFCHT
jgi:putative transposase